MEGVFKAVSLREKGTKKKTPTAKVPTAIKLEGGGVVKALMAVSLKNELFVASLRKNYILLKNIYCPGKCCLL